MKVITLPYEPLILLINHYYITAEKQISPERLYIKGHKANKLLNQDLNPGNLIPELMFLTIGSMSFFTILCEEVLVLSTCVLSRREGQRNYKVPAPSEYLI